MVENKIVFGKWRGAIDAGVMISGKHHEPAPWVSVVVPLVLLVGFNPRFPFFLVNKLAACRYVAWQVN